MLLDVAPEHPLHHAADRDDPLLAALGHPNSDVAACQVEVVDLKAGQLRDSEPCVEQQQNDGRIAPACLIRPAESVQQVRYLVWSKGLQAPWLVPWEF